MTNKTTFRDVVLVVDDSPETLSMLNDALDNAGMTTLVALEGRQALNIARKMAPDIILLDALMPAMDGFSTCIELKKDSELKAIPVIFMTGLSDTESIVKGFEAGSVDYVTKPINPTELVARIKVHLTNARMARSAQTALDSAGQNICAVTLAGDLIWATPQVHQLLEVSPTHSWSESLREPIRAWLSHNPEEEAVLRVPISHANLKWIFLGQSGGDEFLLRVINEDQPDESFFLKEAFQVTLREAEVLLWVAKGKTNREIAQILNLSPRTINKHLEQLFKKIEVDNRTSAATAAIGALQKQRGF